VAKKCVKTDCLDGQCDIEYLISANPIGTGSNGTLSQIFVSFNGGKGSSFTQVTLASPFGLITLIFGVDTRTNQSVQLGGFLFGVEGGSVVIGNITYQPTLELPQGGIDRCTCGKDDIKIDCNSSVGKICCIRRSLVREICRKSR